MLNSKNVPEKQELVLMPEHIETAQLGCRNKILSTNKDKIYFMVLVMYIRKIQLEDYTYIHNLWTRTILNQFTTSKLFVET